MGLQGQLNDVASDSIPLYLLALFAAFFRHLRSLLHNPLLSSSESDPFSILGSGLAGLVLLSDQLSLNCDLSYAYAGSPSRLSECVFCLSGFRDGERVRKLSCCHVFHKGCLDGWFDQMRFSCPLCRSSVVSPNCVDSTRRRLGDQLVSWFAVR